MSTTEPVRSWCSVALPDCIFAGPNSKAEFDKINLQATIHGWKPAETETVLRNDGRTYEGRCHSKAIEQDGVTVVFQWFEYRVAEAAQTASAP